MNNNVIPVESNAFHPLIKSEDLDLLWKGWFERMVHAHFDPALHNATPEHARFCAEQVLAHATEEQRFEYQHAVFEAGVKLLSQVNYNL